MTFLWPGEYSELGRKVTAVLTARQGFGMLDFFYIAIAVLFFLGLWAFTKACDRL